MHWKQCLSCYLPQQHDVYCRQCLLCYLPQQHGATRAPFKPSNMGSRGQGVGVAATPAIIMTAFESGLCNDRHKCTHVYSIWQIYKTYAPDLVSSVITFSTLTFGLIHGQQQERDAFHVGDENCMQLWHRVPPAQIIGHACQSADGCRHTANEGAWKPCTKK
jgi:hypothetical protein